MQKINKSVQDYYGKQLKSSADLKTNACCTLSNQYPKKIKKILSEIHEEVLKKYYGCGLTIPSELTGLNILDLGSGSGRDCFLASKLVGDKGHIIGVDMTDEQLFVANKYIDFHTKKFGYTVPNVEFKKGHIEKLDQLGLTDDSLDLIISNCVLNLSTNKQKIFTDCYNKLKQGGEMYFSDVYVNKRIPKTLAEDPVIHAECLGGALYWNDFLIYAKNAGFSDPRVAQASPVTIENKALEKQLQGFKFYSITYRLFKVDGLEGSCEDFGHSAEYLGTMEDAPDAFTLDREHIFKKGKREKVSGNTYLMLNKSRFKKHFNFFGSFDQHLGIFLGRGASNSFSGLHDFSSTGQKTTDCC